MNLALRDKLDYHVKLNDFEGPLDLLLSLVEKRKLFINDITLSKVSDDYVNAIRELENFPMRDVSGFLLIASTLVLIKSKSLLPALPLTDEEEGDIENLEERLKMYGRIRALTEHVDLLYGKTPVFRARKQMPRPVFFAPDEKTTLGNIMYLLDRILENLPKEMAEPEARVKQTVRLEDVMKKLKERVENALSISFRDFGGDVTKGDRATVIVSFIAILELVKDGSISVRQDKAFDDIAMEPTELQIPRYNEYNNNK